MTGRIQEPMANIQSVPTNIAPPASANASASFGTTVTITIHGFRILNRKEWAARSSFDRLNRSPRTLACKEVERDLLIHSAQAIAQVPPRVEHSSIALGKTLTRVRRNGNWGHNGG